MAGLLSPHGVARRMSTPVTIAMRDLCERTLRSSVPVSDQFGGCEGRHAQPAYTLEEWEIVSWQEARIAALREAMRVVSARLEAVK
jgi:hypothetical protein